MFPKLFLLKYLLLKKHDYLDFIQFGNKQKPACLLDARFALNPLFVYFCKKLHVPLFYLKDKSDTAIFVSYSISFDIFREAWKNDDHEKIGLILGYPSCCVENYSKNNLATAHSKTSYYELYKKQILRSQLVKKYYTNITMYPLDPHRMCSHIPCSWSCVKTLDNNRERKKIWDYQPKRLKLWVDATYNFVTRKPSVPLSEIIFQ